MRILLKLLTLPMLLIISVIRLLLTGATKLYCLVAGIAINLLIIGAVLAIFTGQWFALAVFGVLFVAIMMILFGAGTISVVLDNLREKLLEV